MTDGSEQSATTGGLDGTTVNRLADAVVALDPQPRGRRWVSVSLCIVDAVWSIGASYDNVVVPVVRNLAAKLSIEQPTIPATGPIGADPLPVNRITELGVDELTALTNRQRTSTRGGILKADAVLRHARIFSEHGVTTMVEALALFADQARFDTLDAALRSVPGEGGNGVRRSYLWMLIGDDDLIKPDRMVLRWLDYHGVTVDPEGARHVVVQLIPPLSRLLRRDVTAWEIDHAMWNAGRALGKQRRQRPAKGGA